MLQVSQQRARELVVKDDIDVGIDTPVHLTLCVSADWFESLVDLYFMASVASYNLIKKCVHAKISRRQSRRK